MPATIVPIGQREGTYVVLEAVLPGKPARNIGVFLADLASDRAWVRLREQFHDWAEPEDAEVLAATEDHLRLLVEESGALACLAWLKESFSNVIRVSDRQTVAVDSFTRVLEQLFTNHIETVIIQPFRTHIPLYSLRAAAGSLGEEMEPQAEDWVRIPDGVRAAEDLFVAYVVGHSMEPRIPDGSLNLFRLHPAGSRQNKILLIQRYGIRDESARFTVKRYTSRKIYSGEDQWEHERIRLEPLNPEYEAWDVEPQDFAVVAEWLRVLE
jgi:phage repressor protein C with HTH and peptisase S24 domain